MKNLNISLLTFILLSLFNSCGKYEKILPTWEVESPQSKVITIGFTENSLDIPKLRDGFNKIESVGGIFEELFGELGNQGLNNEKNANNEVEFIISQDMPALERINLDAFDEIKLNSVVLKILDKNLSLDNNLNFIKDLRLMISYENILKIDEVEIVKGCQYFLLNRPPLKDQLPAITKIDDKLSSWKLVNGVINQKEMSVNLLNESILESEQFEQNLSKLAYLSNDQCDSLASSGAHWRLKKYEVLNYNESLSKKLKIEKQRKLKFLNLLSDYTDNIEERKVYLDETKHKITKKDGEYLKNWMKFKVNNLDWKTILKNNSRFYIHIFIKADVIPPAGMSNVSVDFNISLKKLMGTK